MNSELRAAVIALLHAHWKTIGYNYDNLAATEQELITRAQFNKLVTLMFQDKKPATVKEVAEA